MKKLILCASLLFVAFPAFCTAADDYSVLEKRAQDYLTALINIDTSEPEPNETEAARFIYKQLNKYGIDWDILIPRPGRANILARLKGSDSAQKPLLLISHLDTASAAENWTYPPYKATLENGNIYGLGSTDAKNYTAVYLALFTWIKEHKIPLKRDVIFLATSGEEVGSTTGLKWLANEHWGQINPAFALNEGGGIIRDKDGISIVFAEASTKMYMDIKITAYGTAGHSSMPSDDNAVYRLSQALSKISQYNAPARMTPTTYKFFKAIAPLQDEDAQTTMHFLLGADEKNRAMAAEIVALDPFFRTQLKNTITPTVLTGGKDSGATSSEASALLNARLLPGTDPDTFLEELKKLFEGDDEISLEVVEQPELPFPAPMDGSDPLFASIEKAGDRLVPHSITVPGMSPASGDSEFLRRKGVITYGLGPNMDPTQENRTHGADEFISVKDLSDQLKFVASVVYDFAAGQEFPLPAVNEK